MPASSGFSKKEDFFSLVAANNGLQLKSSQDGKTSQVAEASNEYGDTVVKDIYGEVYAPTCEYVLIGEYDLSALALGDVKTYKSTTFLMITNVTITTAPGQSPTLSVSGVQVDSATVRRSYALSGTLSPRSKAQDPFGALASGLAEKCSSITSTAAVDAHVQTVTGVPVFADASHATLSVQATMVDTAGTGSISAASGSGYELVPVASTSYPDSAYMEHSATLVKYLADDDADDEEDS